MCEIGQKVFFHPQVKCSSHSADLYDRQQALCGGLMYRILPISVKKYVMYVWKHVARVGEERGAYRFLVGKPEGRRPLGRPRRRWVDNIRMYLQEGWPRIGTGGGRL